MAYPLLTADCSKLRHNLDTLAALCAARGVSVSAVTKAVCADARLAQIFAQSGVSQLADSRLQNLMRLPRQKPRLLLRISDPREAGEVVRNCEMSLQSEVDTLRALGAAAREAGVLHRVALLIDLGDLREGVFYRDWAGIAKAADAACAERALELVGVGANLTCYGAILPDEQNLGELARIADALRKRCNLSLPFVSGGNSSSLGLMRSGRMPRGITNLRLGESILLGRDTAACAPLPGLFTDVFTLSARLVEVQLKPSMPIGVMGANAFGERPSFIDTGEMRRGILAVGRQDVDESGLTPRDSRVRILGASSDHLLVDLSAAPAYEVGDTLDFTPSYGALLRASTSAYVDKAYCG